MTTERTNADTDEATTTDADRAAVRAEYRRLRGERHTWGMLSAGQAILWARSTAALAEWIDRADGLGQSDGTRWTDAANGLDYHATLEIDEYLDLSCTGDLSSTDHGYGRGRVAYDRTEDGNVGLDRNTYRYVVPEMNVAAERSSWSTLGRHAADCAARAVWKSQRDTLIHYADGEVQGYYLRVRVTHGESGVQVADSGLGGIEIDSFTPHKESVAWLADSLRDVADEATSEALDRLEDLRSVFATD